METKQKEEIIQTILSMPPLDRIEIIDRLYESFDDEDQVAYDREVAEEADRRVEAFLRGEMETIPAEEVYKEILNIK